eukprot:GHVR01060036.1.p1 GENE.GHVR01060036.1~~GHVR01060036.1.p1  ORF type:complete len:709 (+),score=215.55 GHVR01060036.1:134-2260(+)
MALRAIGQKTILDYSQEPEWPKGSPEAQEGYLKKLSPNVFSGWQERYFRVADKGNVLVYWKKKPIKGNIIDPPSGLINISSLRDIVTRSALEFTLISTERDWVLMSNTAKEKDQWVSALMKLLSNIRKTRTEEEERNKEKFSSVLLQQANLPTSKTAVYVDSILNPKKKQIENEILRGVVTNINEKIEFIKLKGVYDALNAAWSNEPEGFLHNILFGGLRFSPQTIPITPARKFFFLLVSSRPISPGRATEPSPCNLYHVDLPYGMKKDTLYIFTPDATPDPPLDALDIIDANPPELREKDDGYEIVVKFTVNNKTDTTPTHTHTHPPTPTHPPVLQTLPSSTTLNTNTNTHTHTPNTKSHIFIADSRTDAVAWVEGIFASTQCARAILKGRQLSPEQEMFLFDDCDKAIKRNEIAENFKIFLIKLIEECINSTNMPTNINEYNEEELNNFIASKHDEITFEKLLPVLETFSNGCASLLDSAVSVVPPRKDVCAFLVLNYTRRVCGCLGAMWKGRDVLPPGEVLCLMEFLSVYSKGFAHYTVLDREVEVAIEDLSEAAARRVLANIRGPVLNLIKNERDAQPFREGGGPLQTNAPVDLFRLFADQVEFSCRLQVPVFISRMVEVCKSVINIYQVNMAELFEHQSVIGGELTPQYVCAQLNNTALFVDKCRELSELAQKHSYAAVNQNIHIHTHTHTHTYRHTHTRHKK